MSRLRACLLVSAGLLGLTLPGCYSNVATEFPEGFEPFETPHLTEPAPATATDACPETLVLAESRGWMDGHVAATHASACIHAPLTAVWDAIRDPETGHDPTSTNLFTVLPEPVAEECDGLFETSINAGSPISVDFRLCWRAVVVSGTDTAPVTIATRWQKVFGSSAIRTLEGSLVAEQFPGDPNISVVHYQYHLAAASTGPSNYQTIQEYLTVIYDRLRRRSHGETL